MERVNDYNAWCFKCGCPTESNEVGSRCWHCHRRHPTGLWKRIRVEWQCYRIARKVLSEPWSSEVQLLLDRFGERAIRRFAQMCGPQTEIVLRYAIPHIHRQISTVNDFLNWKLLSDGIRLGEAALPKPIEKERWYDDVEPTPDRYEGGYSDFSPIVFIEGTPGHEGGCDRWTEDPAEEQRVALNRAAAYLGFAFSPVAECLRTAVKTSEMPWPEGSLPIERVSAELENSGATVEGLAQFLRALFRSKSRPDKMSWDYVARSVQLWARTEGTDCRHSAP